MSTKRQQDEMHQGTVRQVSRFIPVVVVVVTRAPCYGAYGHQRPCTRHSTKKLLRAKPPHTLQHVGTGSYMSMSMPGL